MSRKELAEIQEQIDYGRQVEERLKEELKELNGNINLLEHDLANDDTHEYPSPVQFI